MQNDREARDALPEFVAAGECVTRRGWRHQPECLDWHKLILSKRGVFRLRAQNQGFELPSNSFLIVPAGVWWQGENQMREGDRFRWIMFRSPLTALRHGHCGQNALLDSLFEALLLRLKDESFGQIGRELLTGAILHELEYQTHLQCEAPGARAGLRDHDIAHQAILEMKDGLAAPLDLALLAARLQLNPDYLRRTFKAATGHTPARYHQRLRIEAAKERLSQGSQSVAEVARELGFGDPTHFSRVFKRTAGYSPGQQRGQEAVAHNVDGEFYPFVRRF